MAENGEPALEMTVEPGGGLIECPVCECVLVLTDEVPGAMPTQTVFTLRDLIAVANDHQCGEAAL